MMLRQSTTASLFAVVCTFLPAQDKPANKGAAVPAAVSQQAITPTVGVVDMSVAFEQCPRWIRLKGELDEMKKKLKEQLDPFSQRIEELKGTMKLLDEDSMEYREKSMTLDMLQGQRQQQAKFFSDQLDLEAQRSQLQVYGVIEQAVAKVAKARGIQMVHRKLDVEPAKMTLDKMSPREVQLRLMAFEKTQVLYSATELDITGDVVKELMVWPDDTAAPTKSDDGKTSAAKTPPKVAPSPTTGDK